MRAFTAKEKDQIHESERSKPGNSATTQRHGKTPAVGLDTRYCELATYKTQATSSTFIFILILLLFNLHIRPAVLISTLSSG
jgi:hypothetical protein